MTTHTLLSVEARRGRLQQCHRGAAWREPLAGAGPDPGAARRQRRGQDHDAQGVSNLLPAERGRSPPAASCSMARRRDETPTSDLVRAGLVQVLEGRHCFRSLTVEENLITGGMGRGAQPRRDHRRSRAIYGYFPRLKEKRRDLRRPHIGRRAADDRHRPGADVAAAAAHSRRAVDGARAAGRGGHLRAR